MEIDSFIQEIIANPRDDHIRLVFADFLEEQGDPRAELIRIQLERKEISRFDKQYAKLRKKELQLLRKHGGFGSAPGVVRVLDTHGGFVDSIEVTVARFIKLQDEIFAAAPIREVHLKAKSKKFDRVRESPYLARLARISLNYNDATNDELIRFVKNPNLKTLEGLTLNASEMAPSVAIEVAQSSALTELKKLELYGHFLNTSSCRAIAESAILTKLEDLQIASGQTDDSLHAIAASPNCRGLKRLYVSGDFTGRGVQALQAPGVLEDLHTLVLNSYTTRRGLGNGFNVATPLPKLRHVEVQVTSGGDQLAIDISQNYQELDVLDLGASGVSDRGAMALAESPLFGNLKKLVLTGNEITEAGAIAIAESPHRKKGLKLYMRSNPLSVRAVKEIKAKYGRTFGNLGNEEWNWRYRTSR